MTPKMYLRGARTINRQLGELDERIERLRAKVEAGRMSSITGMPRGGDSDWTKTVDRLIELERYYNARERELVDRKMAIHAVIDQVDDARMRELLELRYIDGMTWEAVAERMGYSTRQVTRLHGYALRMVRVPEEMAGENAPVPALTPAP